jgi:ATP-dependent DNA ligase
MLIVFDLLVDDRGRSLVEEPLKERRPKLESFAKKHLSDNGVRLSRATTALAQAKRWFQSLGGGLDGIIAKRTDSPYCAGSRDCVVKIKHQLTADCVVGGYRYASKGGGIGSMLLGLYDSDGLLHHVGFTASMPAQQKAALKPKLEKLRKPASEGGGFTGRAPGGPSRWSTERSSQWEPVAPELVVEVRYDHFTGDRFRHGTAFLRWRPDKLPRQCTMDQVKPAGKSSLRLLG